MSGRCARRAAATCGSRRATRASKPRILFNYLSHPDDLAELRAGVRLTREIFAQTAFDPYRGREIQPGEDVQRRRDRRLRAREGRERLSPVVQLQDGRADDPMAVVDPRSARDRPRGLRVIDSSIMPSITTGNLNAPTIMLAEKLADHVRGKLLPPVAAANDWMWRLTRRRRSDSAVAMWAGRRTACCLVNHLLPASSGFSTAQPRAASRRHSLETSAQNFQMYFLCSSSAKMSVLLDHRVRAHAGWGTSGWIKIERDSGCSAVRSHPPAHLQARPAPADVHQRMWAARERGKNCAAMGSAIPRRAPAAVFVRAERQRSAIARRMARQASSGSSSKASPAGTWAAPRAPPRRNETRGRPQDAQFSHRAALPSDRGTPAPPPRPPHHLSASGR